MSAMVYTMYPDWPQSNEDLVPLPLVDGPKLKPFDFQGPQTIKFLEHAGQGLHSHVFKVDIRGQIYALKLFRFNYDHNWVGPAEDTDPNDRELMSAFYNYSEPFSSECRAFGRLQEAGCEALAVRCFGYVLLDEDHERALDERFGLSFDGDIDYNGGDEMRTRFLGKDGRAPPIRGIVKQFGRVEEIEDEDKVRPAFFRKMLGDIGRLQKLGIMHLDVATRQLVDGRFSDFSTAITVPHFLTTPELNPGLTPDMRSAMEFQTFAWAMADYLEFDELMYSWNMDYADQKGSISVRAFPGGMGCKHHYQLRSKAAQECVFTFVDPRQYDWKRPGAKNKNRRVRARRWFYDCRGDSRLAAKLKSRQPLDVLLVDWDYSDGFIFPRV
ncbi:kinetochore Sim4 complex subunit FTA2 domain-containing protein [Trichoderma chlorosporum]